MRRAARAPASRNQEDEAKVAAIRGKVGGGCSRFNDEQLLAVVAMCGSVGLACDALAMIPRPRWLERMERR